MNNENLEQKIEILKVKFTPVGSNKVIERELKYYVYQTERYKVYVLVPNQELR